MTPARWYTKQELLEMRTVAFNVGDYDQFATDTKKDLWWFTLEAAPQTHNFFGPYRSRMEALRAWENLTGKGGRA